MIGNQPLLRFHSLPQQSVLLILAFLLLGLSYYRFAPLSFAPEEQGTEVMIEVSGDVRYPGIHFFHRPPTVKEALEKAGGITETDFLRPTLPGGLIETGTRLTVAGEEVHEIKIHVGRMEARKLLVFSIPLDLNRVSVRDLWLVPGIGESLAGEIISYRERRRGFRSVDELREVKGMGTKYRALKPFFVVRP